MPIISETLQARMLSALELALVRLEDLAVASPGQEAETDRHAATIRAVLEDARSLDKSLQMYCAHCGSTNVQRDALCSWNVERQEWQVDGMLDSNSCNACDEQDCVEEREATPVEAATGSSHFNAVRDSDGDWVFYTADDEVQAMGQEEVDNIARQLSSAPALLDVLNTIRLTPAISEVMYRCGILDRVDLAIAAAKG